MSPPKVQISSGDLRQVVSWAIEFYEWSKWLITYMAREEASSIRFAVALSSTATLVCFTPARHDGQNILSLINLHHVHSRSGAQCIYGTTHPATRSSEHRRGVNGGQGRRPKTMLS